MTPPRAGIDRAHYHGWEGRPRGAWRAVPAVARVALLQVFRRKLYWFALAMGLMMFLLYFVIIYVAAQFDAGAAGVDRLDESGRQVASEPGERRQRRGDWREWLMRQVNFSPQPGDRRDNGYLRFMQRQSLVVLILLAFSGSLVVGADYRQGSLAFYLARGIDRRHYLLGKWLGISGVICALTVLPAIVLFIEYGLYTSNLDYWLEFWWIVPSICGYGLVLCVVLGIVVMTVSAYLHRTAPIAITCFSLFTMPGMVGRELRRATGNRAWNLIDLWADIRYVGRYFFDPYYRPDDAYLGWWALAILATICTACLIALVRRVAAVDVVE